jgi:hypothetical protein
MLVKLMPHSSTLANEELIAAMLRGRRGIVKRRQRPAAGTQKF